MTAPDWRKVTAIFGGRFDPPHEGHRQAIRGLLRDPGVRQVIALPSGSPAYKPCVASAEDRAEMARLAFGADAEVDLRELARARATGQATYTFDTLSELQGQADRIAFVIGADQLEQLPTWKRFPEVLALSHWIVLARQPDGDAIARRVLAQWSAGGLVRPSGDSAWTLATGATPGTLATHRFPRSLRLVPTNAPDWSSTRIREAIARDGVPPPGSLPPGVAEYLMQHRLYGTRGT